MIVVQSMFRLLPDSRDEALELLRNMVRLCRQEHGCLTYEYYEGVTDPHRVVLLQEWEDADCLQGHYQTEHMEEFLSRLGRYLDSPVRTRSYIAREEADSEAQRPDKPSVAKQTIH